MKRHTYLHTYIEFRENVEKTLKKEKDDLTWNQHRIEGNIEQARPCYTWVRQLENEVGLTRERSGHHVYWKLERR